MKGNDFIAWMLRSPFHALLSNGMTLVTVTGCITGKKYTTPVEYYEQDGYLWVITNRDRTWWRNLRGGADVGLLLKHKAVQGYAEAVSNEEAVIPLIRNYLFRKPFAAKPMHIRIENNVPNMKDIERTAKERLFVKIKLEN